eukprot:CAMPEP_0172857364 /NCGR_PEP_ID=MMETSP1075-20121228/64583_1 /TAXON_ID=2916 /ORGANISM="Ceratium fusus, Strain PA161109" /LENGTH=397 /DNA_ID=CAMNT_0013704683 /DNA_START=62 /DNA_END=1253 /DNA_ORIENTATION=+
MAASIKDGSDESVRSTLPVEGIRVAVIGMPGHGKSTFLNAMVNIRGEFPVGAGGRACTQEVITRDFALEVDGVEFQATLIDTMGFPDPDPKQAAARYDDVINCCNKPLNAIVWLVRCERELAGLVEQYKVLMREFNNANPPIIMVVNGTESYEDEDERRDKKESDLSASIQFGKDIAEAAGIRVLKIIPGAEKKDLKLNCKELSFSLIGTTPKGSAMKTFAQLKDQMQLNNDPEKIADLELQKMREQNGKVRKNIQALKDQVHELERKKRAKLGNIPFVGKLANEYFGPLIEHKQKDIQLLEEVLGQGEESFQTRFDLLVEAGQDIRRAFSRMKEALLDQTQDRSFEPSSILFPELLNEAGGSCACIFVACHFPELADRAAANANVFVCISVTRQFH